MDNNKVCRMSMLFEKMVAQNATTKEQRELKSLYSEYIEDGRQCEEHPRRGATDYKPVMVNY
tara:strand:- start:266 stop:451 length:186 start_codon:yes stop_codon:yes gene_type:complete